MVYSLGHLLTLGGAGLAQGFCLEVYLESISWDYDSGPRAGVLESLLNVGSHSLQGMGISTKNVCVATWGINDLFFSGPTPSVLATLLLPGGCPY